MPATWISILPPFIVLLLGFLTRRVFVALLCGVFAAAFIAQDYSVVGALSMGVKKLWANSDLWRVVDPGQFWGSWNLFICIFLLALGIMVSLISASGAAYAFRSYASRHIKTSRDAQSMSLLLSVFFFIDDYFSSLTVGSVMHPLTDQFKVPRVKLAFLVDAMAAPLAILCPVSCWVAAIIGFLTENGVNAHVAKNTLVQANPFSVYAHILPFLFYSFAIMSAAWFIVRYGISFGPMGAQERAAQRTGDLFGGKKSASVVSGLQGEPHATDSVVDFVLPVFILFCAVVGGMLFSGGFIWFGGDRGVVAALQHANAAKSLVLGGVLSVLVCTVYFVVRKRIALRSVPRVYWQGLALMGPTILILLLAWTLGDILREDLKTGQFLASLLVGSVPLYILPAMFFGASFATSVAIGSSWGTIAILLPIAIPMIISLMGLSAPVLIEQVPLLFPVLGALFSGAVAGDHISPISDTTLMSSTSTGSNHIDHVHTQTMYALPVVCAVGVAFCIAGLLIDRGVLFSAAISGVAGVLLSGLFLLIFDRLGRVKG